MPNIDVKKYGEVLGRGLVATFAPSILKGALVELFKERKVDVKKATGWVLTNSSLWDSFEPERKEQFKQLASKIGDISWIDSQFVLDAIKDDFPSVASLFLGWRKAANWLNRQTEDIKKEIRG